MEPTKSVASSALDHTEYPSFGDIQGSLHWRSWPTAGHMSHSLDLGVQTGGSLNLGPIYQLGNLE